MTDNNTNPTYNIQIVYYIDWIEYKENWNNQSEIYICFNIQFLLNT